ncbi:DUF4249 domain-containing protein [Salegentibacter chungangensis]|uniref:DUF4249 domain-containing protein n=1 Tax=Salegentibacter chungangensis TaxID=1335724 RepID=A0ABW3NU86_9FLAO
MKFRRYIFLITTLVFTSCEKVVDIPLENSEPRLVVEASLLWEKGTEGNVQKIKLSTTSPFYNEGNPPVEDAQVSVYSENGEEFQFVHNMDGHYINQNFRPELNAEYRLEIEYKDQVYSASETMVPVSDIEYIEQTKNGGFNGDDIEIKVFYKDPPDERNYYLFLFRDDKATLEIYEDEFTDGNLIFGYYSNEDIEQGDEINIEMAGISKAYYEYLFILRSQVGGNNGGPFETKPATVKGNILNETNRQNYAFGYFRLSQTDTTIYTVE